jgi:hypothetical protein
MAIVNKFNIHWQIVRVDARKIKDPAKKIEFVLQFLDKHKNVHNYGRVLNWIKMTGVAYKGDTRKLFEDAAAELQKNESKYSSTEDNDNDLSKVPRSDLEKVYKDLSTRKYGFQFANAPKAHVDFLASLKKHLEK